MKIAHRLPAIVIGCSLVTALVIGIVSYRTASRELIDASAASLTALRETRDAEFSRYLTSIQGDVDLLASNLEVQTALKDFSKAFSAFGISRKRTETMLKRIYHPNAQQGDPALLGDKVVGVISDYNKLHQQFDPWFRLLQKVRGYYDIFLIDQRGDVVYSVVKEADFATNLFVGEWSKSSLASTLDGALSDPPDIQRQFVDFQSYQPSGGNPASFISAPVYDGETLLGVLAFQMPIGRINEIMSVTSGMGSTGETYIVGSNLLMRTDSRFSENSTILSTRVNTTAVEAALNGKTGVEVISDYRGELVLSAYGPIDFGGVRWAILSEIDYAEVLNPVWEMRNFLLNIGVLVGGLVIVAGSFLARSITAPIASLSRTFAEFGAHRSVEEIPHLTRRDEIGDMARGFKELTQDVEGYVSSLSEKTTLLGSLSEKLSKYVSPQIYQSIFAGETDTTVATKRKKLTVFFSDIKDFTDTTSDLEPEDLTSILNRYFSEMNIIAGEYGATIDKFIGDAMLMFFGDPESKGVNEDALQCVRMAAAMQIRMKGLQREWQNEGFEKPFRMRIGINTGFCNVGNFGSDDRMDYTIIGSQVNLASRLEGQAEPDGIVMSYETYALARREFDATELAPLTIKGFPKPVRAYALVGPSRAEVSSQTKINIDAGGLRVSLDPAQADAASIRAAIEQLRKSIPDEET
jgi:class 3 adenylate cyclase